jgi:hypothetical protein
VAHGLFGSAVPQRGAGRLAGKGLEAERRDELLGAGRHRHLNQRTGITQAPAAEVVAPDAATPESALAEALGTGTEAAPAEAAEPPRKKAVRIRKADIGAKGDRTQ